MRIAVTIPKVYKLEALLHRRKPKLLLKWHKRLGIATLVSAIIHLILVLIAH